jgi:hypothetical protein
MWHGLLLSCLWLVVVMLLLMRLCTMLVHAVQGALPPFLLLLLQAWHCTHGPNPGQHLDGQASELCCLQLHQRAPDALLIRGLRHTNELFHHVPFADCMHSKLEQHMKHSHQNHPLRTALAHAVHSGSSSSSTI